MAEWVRFVVCPNCGKTKEVNISQNRWKCPHCKMWWGVKSTLWRMVKKVGE